MMVGDLDSLVFPTPVLLPIVILQCPLPHEFHEGVL